METTMCYLHNCCHLYCSATCAAVNNIKHTRPLCEVPNFFFLVFTKFGFFEQILVKVSNIKFHKNLSSGSQADTCGQVGAQLINVDQQTDMTKQSGTFGNLRKYTHKNLDGTYNLETQTNSHLSDHNFWNGQDYKIKKETAPTAMSQRGMKRIY